MPEQVTQAPSAKTYILATLKDGDQVVSQFAKLSGIENYGRDVFSGRKPFNAWKIVGTQHPASGEAVLVRERVIYNGSEIASLQQVKPAEGMEDTHDLDPSNFVPVLNVQRGRNGALHTFDADSMPEGAQAGIGYPVHTDLSRAHGYQKYVILRIATVAEGDTPGTPERRFYLNREPSPTPFVEVTGPSDADEDDPFGIG